MKSTPEIHQSLNKLLRHELTIINQYFLHGRMLKNMGYESLGKVIAHQSIKAMKNADKLIARIFFLEGLPNLQDLGKLFIGEDVAEVLVCDLNATAAYHQDLRLSIADLERTQDYVSRALVQELLHDVETYHDWLEEQQDLIEQLGLANYLQKAVSDA